MSRQSAAAAAFAALFLTAAAGAQDATGIVDELRLGVAAHDLVSGSEDGVQITAEAMFTSPSAFRWVGSPRPFLFGSFNTEGLTDLGAAGLAWNARVLPRVSIEGGLGLAYHDGVLDLDLVNTPPEQNVEIKDTRALLGSSVLFRTVAGLDVEVTERWRVGVFYEHYSHGQVLGDGRNQGLDEAGMRLGYRLQ